MASVAAAEPTRYECEYTHVSPNGTTPEWLYFQIDEDRKVAYVLDPFIYDIYGEELKAPYRMMNPTKYEINYRVRDIPLSVKTKADLVVTLRIDMKRMKYTYRSTLSGFDNEDNGAGTCHVFRK